MLLTQGLVRSAHLYPDRIATIFSDRRRTFAESLERIRKLSGALQQLGFKPGDKVAMWAHNSDRYFEYFFAVIWAGGIMVPVNYRWSPAEVLFSLNDAEVSMLLVDAAFSASAAQIRGDVKLLREIVFADDGEAPAGMHDYEKLLAGATPLPQVTVDKDDMVGIFYTGGTTGFPKGVMLSQFNIWSSSMGLAIGGWVPEDAVYCHAAPMFHLADIAMLTTGIINGCTHVFAAAFNPPEVMALIERAKVTEVLLVPTMIQMLIDHPDFADYDLSSLNRIIYGASVISEGLLGRAMLALPNARFSQAYGMTEMGPVISTLGAEYHTPEGMKRGKLRSAGKPNAVVDVRIVDNKGSEVPRGTVGEITAYGPNVMLGYWNRQDENAATLQNGWMHTGDGGYMDEEGYLFIVDRVKDVIISGGENVYSAEVENALGRHDGIAQSAVIGIPSERWGETVHAIIVLKPGAEVTGEEVMAHCHDLIAGYKCPRSVEFRESLPISGAGKIQKNELRKEFWAGKSRGVS